MPRKSRLFSGQIQFVEAQQIEIKHVLNQAYAKNPESKPVLKGFYKCWLKYHPQTKISQEVKHRA